MCSTYLTHYLKITLFTLRAKTSWLDLWWRLQFDWKIFGPKSFLSESVKRRGRGGGVGGWLQPSQRMWKNSDKSKKKPKYWIKYVLIVHMIGWQLEKPALEVWKWIFWERQLKMENGVCTKYVFNPSSNFDWDLQRQWADPICDSINIEMRAVNGGAINLDESNTGETLARWRCSVFILKYNLERDMELFVYLREGSRRPLKARVIIFHSNLARGPLNRFSK